MMPSPLRGLLAACLATALVGCGSRPEPSSDTPFTRILSGLRPTIVRKGAPPRTFALAERMAHYKVPGISIAIAAGDSIVFAKGFGLKQVGTSDSVSITTIFQAASISKPVAATVLLRLVDEGRINLDTNVNTYLTSWKVPENRFTATTPVTLRGLVTHSAGLTVHGFPGYAAGAPVPTVPQILDGVAPANTAPVRVDTTPGAIWRYSGGGITVEQLAMTDVTGEPFPALAARLVLNPIGMAQSTYEQPLPAGRHDDAAAGHRQDGSMIPGRWHTYPEMAAAGLWTTPTDLLRWAKAITSARAGKPNAVLAKGTATDMLTMQKDPSGLGPMLHGSGRAFYFEHGGSNEGYRCQVLYFPETGQGAAVMTNGDAGDALAREVLYAIAAEYQWAEYGPRVIEPLAIDNSLLQQLVGDYPLPQAITGSKEQVFLTVSTDSGRLYIENALFIPRSEVLLLAGDTLLSDETGFKAHVVRSAKGVVEGMDIGPVTLKRK